MPVSASGESAARASIASRTSSSQSSSSGANDTRPGVERCGRIERLALVEELLNALRHTQEPRLQAREAVAHLERPAVHD